ncbi:MAG: dihydroneopterin aldolase [Puniceicoccales bacterium]|jgi:dihydroneopterin aldolase|nr:dihydroneopterin aldolase [Puniceicoccales bacterium]
MDSLFIRGLRYEACHGVEMIEQRVPQVFEISVELRGNFDQAIRNDDIAKTVNYDIVERCLDREIHASTFRLIESLASHLVTKLFEEFSPVMEIRLKLVKKPATWEGKCYQSLGFCLERQRHDTRLSLPRD